MNKIISTYAIIALLFFQACNAQQKLPQISEKEVASVLQTLSADDMRGRSAMNPEDIAKAADFIANEFKTTGLQFLNNETSYRQAFRLQNVVPIGGSLRVNGAVVSSDNYLISSAQEQVEVKQVPKVYKIKKGDDFFEKYASISDSKEDLLVQIDESFKPSFQRLKDYLSRGNMSIGAVDSPTIIYLLQNSEVTSLSLTFTNKISSVPMFNVVGVLPGKSKPGEYVVFSAHYDHLGIIQPVGQDSIANGADDDASGVTAVIELAKYFAQQQNNERTLIFVAFTAE
ncbi:MAG TPA: M28 family peptidase, partial [Pelobium sp.]|nr:M28 family peptidase [Pelobium sp.]